MPGADMQAMNDILKTVYLGPIREQMPKGAILLQRLEKNEEDVEGKEAHVPLLVGYNEGVGARTDGGSLPVAQSTQYEKAIYKVALNYGVIRVSGPTIQATKTNKGAFVRAVNSEIKGMTENFRKDVNRQLFNDGSGVLGVVGNNPTGTQIEVVGTDARKFKRNMKIDAVDPASVTPGDARPTAQNMQVLGRIGDNKIEMTAAVPGAVVKNDYLVRNGSYGLEMMGLAGIVNNVNPRANLKVGNIDRNTAGNDFWKGHVLANGGTPRALTTELMQRAWDDAEDDGGHISLIITSNPVRRKYLSLIESEKRFVNIMKLDGGFSALEYNGKPLVTDPDCPSGLIYFLDESTLALYRMSDFDWMDKDGAVLSRVSGVDAYEAILFLYATLGCSACNRNAVLKDLIVS